MDPNPSKTPIADGWREYERLVVPAGACEAQREATREAFMDGAMTLMALLRNAAGGGELGPDCAMLDAIAAEADAIVKEVMVGCPRRN